MLLNLSRLTALLVALLTLMCSASAAPAFSGPVPSDPHHPLPARAVNRILEQATWGPSRISPTVLERDGFDAWFADQLTAPVSTYSDQPLLNSIGNTNTNVAPTQAEFFINALSGPDQLRQRVAFALSEIWVVSEVDIANASAMPPFLRLLQADAFANYEQIMKDITLSPAMGRYLNMVNNDKGNASKNTSPNENYARELMQLFTIGLDALNVDGSPVQDSTGQPMPAYTQATVTALARALTGWTSAPMPGVATKPHNPTYYLSPMVAYEPNHDTTQKLLFAGFTLPAGQTSERDLTDALHAIFLQSSLPPFVCRQLIQHLITSNPSPAHIARVAEVFINNGQGVRGDMASVVRAILVDPEARAGDDPNAATDPGFGHMREPVLFTLNLLHGLNGSVSTTATTASRISTLGQNLFYAPSVFSYFSPFSRTSGGLPAPEFQIYSTQAASNRINLVNSAIYAGTLDAGTKFDISPYTAAASTPAGLLNQINTVFFHNSMSDALKSAIAQAAGAVTLPSDKAKAALYIALTSGEFQIIH